MISEALAGNVWFESGSEVAMKPSYSSSMRACTPGREDPICRSWPIEREVVEVSKQEKSNSMPTRFYTRSISTPYALSPFYVRDKNLMNTNGSIAFAPQKCHPARGTLLSMSCLVVGGGGMTAPLDPFRSRRWRICVAGSSMG